jgi:cytochrome c oxidase cbb3-type subunit III
LLLALVLLFVPLRAQRATRHPSAARDEGKEVFASVCASCHGLDGRGGEHAPDIATKAETQRLTDAELARIIRQGSASGTMPAFGAALSKAQTTAIVRYLRVLEGSPARMPLPGNPDAGKALFFAKAGCSDCHMVSGEGGFIASDLTAYAAARTPAEIQEAIANPNKNLNERSRAAVITLRDGQKLTGFMRNEDNFSVQFQTLDGAFHLLTRSNIASIAYEPKSLMPDDYAQRLSADERNNLVSYLMDAAAKSAPAPDARSAKE